jgi:putative ABC transport system substrate-binding protein
MMARINRRELIAGAAAWPIAAKAQNAALPIIGLLTGGSPAGEVENIAAFRKGLSELGFVEGRNIAIEFRWGQNGSDRLPELAADLIRRKVDVIATPGSAASALAAKAQTTMIPIVFSTSGDPVQLGLVPSLSRPGGNVTGVTSQGVGIAAKQLGLLRELLPRATRFAALVNPTGVLPASTIKEIEAAASAVGGQVAVLTARTDREIDGAFAAFVQKHAEGLLVTASGLFLTRRVQITTLAARHVMPLMSWDRRLVEAGGLMSYGTNFAEMHRQLGQYTGRILKGEKPPDLPVMQASTFELVINLQTAKTLGIDMPATLLARADDVIE